MDFPVPLARLVDANFNRAREALRVVEDLCRFGGDDAEAQRFLKAMRHRLAALEAPRAMRFLPARDSGRDVGRRGDLGGAPGMGAAAAANFKRLQEALRALEEAARGRDPGLRRGASGLRFSAYEAERRFLPPLVRRDRLEGVRLYVLLDPDVSALPLAKAAREAVRGGAQMLQVRVKGRPAREVARTVAEIARIGRGEGVPVIANDRPEPAADGVHVGLDDLSIPAARRRLAADGIVGATTHSITEARRAREADYLSCGPMFATALKPGLPARGLGYWDAATRLGRPVFAIGGITAERLPGLMRRGVDRIAVCAAVIGGRDVAAAARALRSVLRRR